MRGSESILGDRLVTSMVWSIAVACGAEPGAYHFAMYQPSGRLITGPLDVRHDGLPDLREVRRRLDDVAEPIDHLLVVAESIPMPSVDEDDLDLQAHLLVAFAGVGDRWTRLIMSPAQVATLLGIPAGLDSADVRRVAEQDLGLVLPADLDDGAVRALAFLVAGRREVQRRAAMVRVIAAPLFADTSPAEAVDMSGGGEVEEEPGVEGDYDEDQLARISGKPSTARPTDRFALAAAPDATLLTVADVVALFQVSRSFAYSLKCKIPHTKFGGLRFRKADIEDYLATHTRTPVTNSSRPRPRGMPVALRRLDEVVPGMTREELKKKAGF